ncbi:MAG: hypothetical protein V4592_03075 [Bacteroidota bacterium]
MKINLRAITLLLATAISMQLYATEKKSIIIITGKVSDAAMTLVSKAPYLTYYEDYNLENPSSKHILQLNLHDNTFQVKIQSDSAFLYFDIAEGMIRSVTNDVFLIQKGDSIHIDIKTKDDVKFSGKGAEKLTFQNWAGHLMYSDKHQWSTADKMNDIMAYNKNRAIKYLATIINTLNQDTAIGGIKVRELIKLNVSSSISRQYLSSIVNPIHFPDSAYYNNVKHEVNFLVTQQIGFVVSEDFLIKNSFMYVQYLFELNKAIAKIRTRSWKSPLDIVFPNIKSEFTGVLRDKLLTYCFLDIVKTDTAGFKYLPEAIKIVKDDNSKLTLNEIKIAKEKGARSFQFDLATINNSRLKLPDLKGKVIILETYYAGCYPCRQLSINMEPIAKYFKNRKDVVFISMDGIAKDFKTFKKGVDSKLYGYEQSIYVWTEGLGMQHPLMLFYKYDSFPNLLIIGKDGNIVSANPERPFSDEDSKRNFKRLIETHL